jgi:hypothetical protein
VQQKLTKFCWFFNNPLKKLPFLSAKNIDFAIKVAPFLRDFEHYYWFVPFKRLFSACLVIPNRWAAMAWFPLALFKASEIRDRSASLRVGS